MIDYAKYPWLCSTLPQSYSCKNTDNGSTVSKDEGYNAESLTTESYGTYGLQSVYYKVSENLKRDKIYGEDQLQVIERAFNFMLYTESLPPNVRSYHLQGIWGEDVLTCYVGVTAFKYWSTYGGSDRNTPLVYDDFQPRIGDIVYLPQNDTFYEVRDVKYYQEAFGLTSHTYTLTLRVYKGSKLTIDRLDPTLGDVKDPIYQVATHDFPEQYEMNDVLKDNDILEGNALYKSKNANHMDVLYDPERHAYDKYMKLDVEIAAQCNQLQDMVDSFNTDVFGEFEEHLEDTKEDVKEAIQDTDNLEETIDELKNNASHYEYIDEKTGKRRRD